MARFRLIWIAWCILLGSPLGAAVDPEEDFSPLFNGKDLAGWVAEGPASFVAKDGVVLCDGSGNWPGWLRSKEVFENFVLRLEFQTRFGAESGVFFHAPLHGRISRVGYEVQLGGAGGTQLHSTGAIFDAVAPQRAVRSRGNEGFDELEIACDWPRLTVRLNGELVQDLDVREHAALRYRPRFGYLGFQDRGKPVAFRNVRVRRLPDRVRGEWKDLQPAADLSPWSTAERGSATWSIEDGELVSRDGHGYLLSAEPYRNCELQAYVRSSPLANGGIFFRWLDARDRGFEVQIEDIPDGNDPTGSIYGRVRARELPFTPGSWFLLQVFLEEQRCVVRVDGVVVAETERIGPLREGRIALQMHHGAGWIRWKELRIRRLPAATK
jgi:hypothetical protein